VLDIGCGGGELACFAAQQCDCEVTAANISPEQSEFAKAACSGPPVHVMRIDYHDVEANSDRCC